MTHTNRKHVRKSALKPRSERSDAGIRANILLGQRFLQSSAVINEIIAAADIHPTDTILEIGPGAGALTRALLLARPKRVIAVEKDKRFASYLRETFKDSGALEVIEGDILTMLTGSTFPMVGGSYKIVANLPYYLTSHFLRETVHPHGFPHAERMVLLIQKEVAVRMMGLSAGKRGSLAKQKHSLLSLGITTHATPKIIRSVKPGAFHLPPKVDSAVIQLTNISESFFTEHTCSEKFFFAIARKAFGGKRKMLGNTLSSEFAYIEARDASSPLLDLKTQRPESLTKEDWAALARACAPTA